MLSVHRATRADTLAAALADLLATPQADPFAPEVVSVPSRGVERWLSQTLAARLGATDGDGVCANVLFPFPAGIIGAALSAAGDVAPDDDPWAPERLVWPLIDVAEGLMGEPWLATLARHVGHGRAGDDHPDRRARRFATLRHVADLYDRYAVHRPELVTAWAAGDDSDGNGAPLHPDLAWQAELWRRVRAQVGAASPAERLGPACARLAADPGLVDLPERLAMFGLTRLPAAHLRVLRALADNRDVHLYLLHPSPGLWDRVAAAAPTPATPRRADPTADLPTDALLGSWGRDAREMQITLGAGADADRPCGEPPAPATLLGRLQASIRADAPPPAADERPTLDPADTSVQIHACHGRARQVEVARDAVLHLMAADPTLEPRDVLVMCPDVEEFAPLVHAVFATAGGDGVPDVRVRLADRSLRQTNPVLGVVADLLELPGSRATASQVLDLAARPPVARRFDLDDDDQEQIGAWVRDAGVRWGLDAASREPFGLGGLEANTWRFGLDRILTGVAVADDGALVADVLPLDDVGAQGIDLAGRLAEFVDRLGRVARALTGPQTLGAWCDALRVAADLLTDVPPSQGWQRRELDALLDELAAQVPGGAGPALERAELVSLMADRLRGRPTRAGFRTGALTVCTLVPMRSVPHRVVVVMGLDDGAFPRRGHVDGDDILSRDPRVGDQDVRGEDRQLLLDALMAARDHLVIVHTGNDARTNADVPPAVPVLELRDAVDRAVAAADGTSASAAITVRHPLQPFDARNFTPGALGGAGPWGFDPVARDGARALGADPVPVPPFLDAPLDAVPADVIELDALVTFLGAPMKQFLARRPGVYAEKAPPDVAADALPLGLNGLDGWGVRDRALTTGLGGGHVGDALEAERRRGVLPPGDMADADVARARADVDVIVEACGTLRDVPPRTVEVDVTLPGGRRVVGAVPGVRGDVVLDATASRLKPKRRLAAWARLAALSAHDPGRPWEALIAGKGTGKGAPSAAVATLPPLGAAPADRAAAGLRALAVLVDLYDRGMREPLPIADATSAALAVGDMQTAKAAWEKGDYAEAKDAEATTVFGGVVGLDDLLAAHPAPPEAGPGWDATATTRAERLARRLWDPVLDHEGAGDDA